MTQWTSGLYKLTTFSRFYENSQALLGPQRVRRTFVDQIAQPQPGMRILDVGCGPGGLMPYLPAVDYVGFDLNPKHIAYAQKKYGDRGQFFHGDAVKDLPTSEAGSFDLVVVSGLLHHLTDAHSISLLKGLCGLTRREGRIATLDQVWLPRQHPVAKLLNWLDAGRNVRTPEGYRRLAESIGVDIEGHIYRNLLRVPYDYYCMKLTKRAALADSHNTADRRTDR